MDETSAVGVPAGPRRELLRELASARAARDDARIRDAELALAPSGAPWPETPDEDRRRRLAAAMRALLRHRRPEATICPSDAARAVAGVEWRDAMHDARGAAAALSREGVIAVRQHGDDADIATATGPIRLARGPAW